VGRQPEFCSLIKSYKPENLAQEGAQSMAICEPARCVETMARRGYI